MQDGAAEELVEEVEVLDVDVVEVEVEVLDGGIVVELVLVLVGVNVEELVVEDELVLVALEDPGEVLVTVDRVVLVVEEGMLVISELLVADGELLVIDEEVLVVDEEVLVVDKETLVVDGEVFPIDDEELGVDEELSEVPETVLASDEVGLADDVVPLVEFELVELVGPVELLVVPLVVEVENVVCVRLFDVGYAELDGGVKDESVGGFEDELEVVSMELIELLDKDEPVLESVELVKEFEESTPELVLGGAVELKEVEL